MKWKTLLIMLHVLALLGLQGCVGPAKYKQEVRLGKPIRISPLVTSGDLPFETSPFAANENCMKGNYYHVYETDAGMNGHEVWLCCVPVNELLKDSFSCADTGAEAFISILYPQVTDPDYLKVRYCRLIHATSPDLIYMPACIPAPLQAPDVSEPVR